jgi:cobalt-zinc-cadmium efflux system membrane fusion protein
MSRNRLLLIAIAAALTFGVIWAWNTGAWRSLVTGGKPEAAKSAAPSAAAEGLVKLTADQIAAAKIETATVGPGLLTRRLVVPASVTPDPDLVARVAAKVAGTIAELRKKLGDRVALNEVVAVIDSREVADAKSEFLAAQVHHDLQNTLFQREKGLFEKKITAEQLFLKARTTFAEARLRLDLARQKLASLDMSESDIAALPTQPIASLRRKEIHAPLAGRVIERLVSLGQPVGGEGQAKELYVLSDLSVVEADLAIPAADLGALREGQGVSLTTAEGRAFAGRIVFVNAMITPETRSGHVIASFANPDFKLHPGSLLNAEIALKETRVKIKIPRAAMQMIGNETCVFVRVTDGFVKRKVETGAGDDESVEVTAGLSQGETIAVSNTFVLKAELGKGDIPEE